LGDEARTWGQAGFQAGRGFVPDLFFCSGNSCAGNPAGTLKTEGGEVYNKIMVYVLIAFVAIMALWPLWGFFGSCAEQADYAVVKRMDGYEILAEIVWRPEE
jgi:hypothetical protein